MDNVLGVSETQIGQSTIGAHQYTDGGGVVPAYVLIDAICI